MAHILSRKFVFLCRNHFTLSKFNFEKSKDSFNASYGSMVNPIGEKPLSLHAGGHCYLLYINMEKTNPQCYIIDHSSCQFYHLKIPGKLNIMSSKHFIVTI